MKTKTLTWYSHEFSNSGRNSDAPTPAGFQVINRSLQFAYFHIPELHHLLSFIQSLVYGYEPSIKRVLALVKLRFV